jgi:2-amino-4-hydroxy-6-hydroxymethyldihydropteridine diphosphokinase
MRARTIRAYVALGANLGDPQLQVRHAMDALDRIDGTRVERCSSLYRSAPVGITDQPEFINAVCAVSTELTAEQLLSALLRVERDAGRRRDGPRGGPRTLDLDLLLYGTERHNDARLTLPHPRLHERAFVLYPLMEIAPSLVIPGLGAVSDLAQACSDQRIERLPSSER